MSGSWIPIPDGSGLGLDNLPLGVGAPHGDPRPRPYVAVGEHALDLAAVAGAGLLDVPGLAEPALNRFLAAGPDAWRALRHRLAELLTDAGVADRLAGAVVARRDLTMGLPVVVGDYVDCYSSMHHATNLGRLFRPEGDPLLPNWRHLPVAYHGRAGTIVASGAAVPRPHGLRMIDGAPTFGPTEALDIELEVGFVVGVGNERGHPIPVDRVDDHVYGFALVNDWSARDIQAFEYQPLGPFLGKSFATSLSPWLVSADALAPFRVAPPVQEPPVAPYLRAERPWGLDLHLEALLESEAMRAAGIPPLLLSRTSFADLYWTPGQQLAHVTVNGASSRPGDLVASGTVSGATPGSEGSLIERTNGGRDPIELPDGTTRTYLLDGDRVTLRGWAGDRGGGPHVSLGAVAGTVVTGTVGPGPATPG